MVDMRCKSKRGMALLFAVLAIFLSSMVGCATSHVQVYPGSKKPDHEIAVLSVYPSFFVKSAMDLEWGDFVNVAGLVGHTSAQRPGASYELAPGEYVAELLVSTNPTALTTQIRQWSEAKIEFKFSALPGHTYFPQAKIVGDRAFARIVDAGPNLARECIRDFSKGRVEEAEAARLRIACSIPASVPKSQPKQSMTIQSETQRIFFKPELVEVFVQISRGRTTHLLKSTTDNLRPEVARELGTTGGCNYPPGKPVSVAIQLDTQTTLPDLSTCYTKEGKQIPSPF